MIQANELRVGNWIAVAVSTFKKGIEVEIFKPIQVWGVRSDCVLVDSRNGVFFENIKPIPLTEDVLLKCGFEKIGMAYRNFSFTINRWSNGSFMYGWIGGNIEVKLLHQLQNLYFALTGSELEINL